ncbi:MAG: CoA-binding protein [Planctomycetes bacterium]|nr:CoA-binding protein [Planctomycetota bacterium]
MASHADLHALLNPRAVAVIGASSRSGQVGGVVLARLLEGGRPVYPVHPDESEVCGIRTVPSVDALPDGVDLAVIAVGAARAVEAAEACARLGIAHLLVIAAGFAETGAAGRALQERLAALPGRHPTRILGPNTLGLHVPHTRLSTLFVEHAPELLARGGGVAFVTQSGSVGVEAVGLAANIGFGLRAFVGLGNKCDLDEVDFLEHFAADPGTTCLAFHLENLDCGRRFLEAAATASRRKAVVVLKAGRTPAGAAAASLHTGRLAGSDRVVDGAFRQFGILRAADDEALCDAARTLAALPLPRGPRVGIITPAGGYGVMAADQVETPPERGAARLALASLAGATRERIRAATPPFASADNPVDLTAVADDAMFAAALDALLDDDAVDIVLCGAFFAAHGVTDGLVDVLAEHVRGARKPILAFTLYGPKTERYLRRLHEAGVVGFPSVARVVRAARVLVQRAGLLDAPGGAR